MDKIYSPESEQAILASILRNPSQYTAARDILNSGKDFGWTAYGDVWDAMNRLQEKGLGVDVVTIGDELEREGKLKLFALPGGKQFSGRAALSQIKEIRTTDNWESYAATVQDYAVKRRLDGWITEAHNWTHNGRPSAAIIADLTASFSKVILHGGKIRTHTSTMIEATQAAEEAIINASRGLNIINFGLMDLDKLLCPQKTELIIIAGRPGQGKSGFCSTVALNVARSGKRVKFFTLEMGTTQVTQRLLAQVANISAFKLMNGNLKEVEWNALPQHIEELRNLPIIICDLPAISIGQIRTEARRDPCDLLIVDYIQLAEADSKNDRRDLDIGEVTRGLKALAKELDIPILAAAQLSRETEKRAEKRPILSDLRESGSIENDADSVVFIHNLDNTYLLIVAKHRNGPVGDAPVYFNPETIRFENGIPYRVDLAAASWADRKDVE